MTTELEEQFYKTFEIEPKIYKTDGRDIDDNGDVCSWYIEEVYPEITDRRLLNMICILNNYGKYDCWGVTATRLKDAILENCIAVVVSKLLNDVILEQFKHQIQQLFKGEK